MMDISYSFTWVNVDFSAHFIDYIFSIMGKDRPKSFFHPESPNETVL